MKSLNLTFILRRLATILSVIALTLVLLAGLTGVLLAFYYDPSAGGAYNSLRWISEFVPGGSLIRSLHDITGDAIIVVALLQIFVMFFGRQPRLSWFTAWLSGGFLALFSIGLGWTAMILDWDQIGYWRLKIEVETFAGLPVIGSILRPLLFGGDNIGTATVTRMYTLHSYILSVVAVVLAVVHFAALLYQERQVVEEVAPQPMLQDEQPEPVNQELIAQR
jgi:cytochrome b6